MSRISTNSRPQQDSDRAMGNRGTRGDGSSLKRALLVTGGLALAWLTVETAFKPFLDRLRASISRSDPARDPDEDDNDVEVEWEKGETAAEEKDGKAGGIPPSD